MNIAICDDNDAVLQEMNGHIQSWIAGYGGSPSVSVMLFRSSEDLYEQIQRSLHIDLLFLDIEIPLEMNGLALAEKIRKTNAEMAIVFVSNYAEFACDGYRVDAMRYLLKPVRRDQICEILNTVYLQWKYTQVSSAFLVNEKNGLAVPYRFILYFEVRKHSLYIYRTEGEPICLRLSLQQVQDQLPAELFVRCHRSCIVNLKYISCVKENTVYLADDRQIPVGSRYRDKLFRTLKDYYQGAASL